MASTAASTQNPKKIIRTPNTPIETKIFLKKTMLPDGTRRLNPKS
jgi:hypothetical protein